MTLEKSSNWWETPGLGELSMAAGSIPAGVGTYAVGRELLNLKAKPAVAAGALVGGAQALNNVLQARKNGQSGLITPSGPIKDLGKSLLTGGVGVLGGAGLASIANISGPQNARNMALIGSLIAAGDYARRRGRAAIERRAYDNELNRQMEEYYSKEAQVAWYGHPRLRGSLLNTKVAVVTPPSQTVSSGYEMEQQSPGRVAPAPPTAPPAPSQMQMAAARAASNAMASGMGGVGGGLAAAAGAAGAPAAAAPAASPAAAPARQRPRPARSQAAQRPTPAATAAAPPAAAPAASPSSPATAGAAGAAAAAAGAAGGGFGGAFQRMVQAAQSIPAGAADKPIYADKPQAGGLTAGGKQDPKITAYLMNKKKELAGGGQDPKITAYLMDKKKGMLAGGPATGESVSSKPSPTSSAPSLATLLSSPEGQVRLPEGLTGSLMSGAGMVSRGAGAVGSGVQNFMQSATNPLRNIPNFFG